MEVIIAWVLAHSALIAGAAVGVLDLIFALSPGLESNGILHAIYLQLKKLLPAKEDPKV